MHKIIFVCHGNICRSPMAEAILKDIALKHGQSDKFVIDSAATSTEEIGNPVYPPAQRTLASHGISGFTHRARQFTKADYNYFDAIYVMDNANLRNIKYIIGSDAQNKVKLLLGNQIIDDPWYTGDFEGVFAQIYQGCTNIFNQFVTI